MPNQNRQTLALTRKMADILRDNWNTGFREAEARMQALLSDARTEANTLRAVAARFAQHLAHCVEPNACQYGETDCPALTPEWAWLGIKARTIRADVQRLTEENAGLRRQIEDLRATDSALALMSLRTQLTAAEADRDTFSKALCDCLRESVRAVLAITPAPEEQ